MSQRQAVTSESITVLGVDPGFAKGGASVLEYRGGAVRLLELVLFGSKKAAKKLKLRVSNDDVDRVQHILLQMSPLFERYPINAVCAEAFQPHTKSSSGWKCGLVYGALLGVCQERSIPFFPHVASDLKRAFNLRGDASKEAVQRSLEDKVIGFEESIKKVAKTNREHPSDATGHAYLGIGRIHEMRVLGVL